MERNLSLLVVLALWLSGNMPLGGSQLPGPTSNWDVARVASLTRPGTPAVFK